MTVSTPANSKVERVVLQDFSVGEDYFQGCSITLGELSFGIGSDSQDYTDLYEVATKAILDYLETHYGLTGINRENAATFMFKQTISVGLDTSEEEV